MCLMIFAHQVSPHYPLVVAANRDEYHARPTAASDFWPDQPHLLAGRDLLQGGTWMGITRTGRFAAVTNYRDPARTAAAPRSRGELPLGFLLGSQAPQVFLDDVAGRAQDYAGFNLLVGDRHGLWYASNRGREPLRQLAPGLYGLSNGALGDQWPKTGTGTAALRAELLRGPTPQGLLQLLGDHTIAADDALPDTGVGIEMERMLSPRFIASADYGTRASTALLIDRRGRAVLWEQNFAAGGTPTTLQRFDWELER